MERKRRRLKAYFTQTLEGTTVNRIRVNTICRARIAALPLLGIAALTAMAQTTTTTTSPGDAGASTASGLITTSNLPAVLAALEVQLGGRLTAAANAQISLSGTVTDAAGSRTATILVQAPGLFSYRDGNGAAVTFDGSAFQTSSGQSLTADQAIVESLVADLPDTILLQALNGGGVRVVGSHFRTDNGKTPNYTGPYWTLVEFAPVTRPGLTWGQPLQQELFLAIDEKTRLPAEVRRAVKTGSSGVEVTQTQFGNWTQQNGQWFPGSITRLENGRQTLSFTVSAATTGPASAASTFVP